MMVGTQGSSWGVLEWQRDNLQRLLVYALAGTAAVVLSGGLLALPTLPLAVFGGAIGIFTSFRANQSYARWWEGRQLWGALVNTSRRFSSQILAYAQDLPEADRRAIVLRQAAYVHVLRCALRDQDPLQDPEVIRLLSAEERDSLRGQTNAAFALLDRQFQAVGALARVGALPDPAFLAIDDALRGFLDVQGGCERIKRTPIPKGYAFLTNSFVAAFAALLPLALVGETWGSVLLAPPATLAVCAGFLLMSESARVLEDPFTMFWNGLPLSQLSAMIEANLRQRLGDTEYPPIPTVNAAGILM